MSEPIRGQENKRTTNDTCSLAVYARCGNSCDQCRATRSAVAGETRHGAIEIMTSTTSAECWRTVTSIARRSGRGIVECTTISTRRRRELTMQLRAVSSVGAVATAALEQGPKEFVYVRVKRGGEGARPALRPRKRVVDDLPRSRRVCAAVVVGGGLGAAAILPDGCRDVL